MNYFMFSFFFLFLFTSFLQVGDYWVWRVGFVPYGIKQKAWAPPWSIRGGECLKGNLSVIPAVERRWAEGTFVLALV